MKLTVGELTAMAALAAPIGGFVGAWLIKRMSRSQDQAATRKTKAETDSLYVSMARNLVTDISEQRARDKADAQARITELRADHEARLTTLSSEVDKLRTRQDALQAALATHAMWDDAAVARLRTVQSDWPDPPPVDLGE